MAASIVICRCPAHPTFWSLSVDTEDGGVRVLGGKCCPLQYKTQVSWGLTETVRDNLIRAMEDALEATDGR